MKNKTICFRKAMILLFWLAVWQGIALLIHNRIIFVGPAEMVQSLVHQLPSPGFWQTIAHSFGKISLGFLSAFFLGIVLGSAGYRFPLLQELLEPIILLMKSVPVASFVILALIWIGARQLSILIAFLVVFPMIYINTTAGLAATDPKLLEMAAVFHIPTRKRIRYIYLPALMPYLLSGCKVALGMSWKSGIAAEVIGVPAFSIGEKLYMAKIYLNTADLFAWTFVIILISALFERAFLLLLTYLSRIGGSYEHTPS
ncbi:MAG: ABC transporter permease subunit [Hungatella sp.]